MRLAPLYQEDRERARQEGFQQGKQQVILRWLNRRVGEIDLSLIEQVQRLSIEQLEALGEQLFDFSEVADLAAWLNQQQETNNQ